MNDNGYGRNDSTENLERVNNIVLNGNVNYKKQELQT